MHVPCFWKFDVRTTRSCITTSVICSHVPHLLLAGMFDGGAPAAPGPVPARNESTPTVGGVDTRERRPNMRGESDPGLAGVVGVGVRSNSVGGEENEEEEAGVSVSIRLSVPQCPHARSQRSEPNARFWRALVGIVPVVSSGNYEVLRCPDVVCSCHSHKH